MVTEDAVLKALDKPRRLSAIKMVVDPAGRDDTLQEFLMAMREKGRVRFDIKKGTWAKV